MVFRFLVVAVFAYLSACIERGVPSPVSVPVLSAIVNSTGECLIRIPHRTIADTYVYACGQIPRGGCNSAGVFINARGLNSLRAGIAQIGINVATCPLDALAETNEINTLQAPALPEFAKAGGIQAGQGAQSRFIVVESCTGVGLLAAPYVTAGFGRLQSAAEILANRNPAIYLNRYSTVAACRDAIPMTTPERETAGSLRAGTFRDFVYCDAGGGAGDPGLPDCPEAVIASVSEP